MRGYHSGLTLVGDLALRQLPAIVAAAQEGAERGMGKTRLRGRLRRVDALAGGAPMEAATSARKAYLISRAASSGERRCADW